MDTFDSALLQQLDSMDHNEAIAHCKDIIESTKTKANKRAALLRDIDASPNVSELSRIMWNVLLAGEGLVTINSQWQKQYGK